MRNKIKSVSCSFSSNSKGMFIIRNFRLAEPIEVSIDNDVKHILWANGTPSSIPTVVPATAVPTDTELMLMGISLSKALTGSPVEVEIREEQLKDGTVAHKAIITDIEY